MLVDSLMYELDLCIITSIPVLQSHVEMYDCDNTRGTGLEVDPCVRVRVVCPVVGWV